MCDLGTTLWVKRLTRRNAVVGYKWLKEDFRSACPGRASYTTAHTFPQGQCGFYAHRQPVCHYEVLPPRLVRVALWGTVVVCTSGWRATYAELLPAEENGGKDVHFQPQDR